MRWRENNLWRAGIAIAALLLLLLLMVWIPASEAGAYEGASGLTTPGTGTVQAATPTEDATVTALNKEKLQHENNWWWNYGATILTSLISTLTLAAAGVFTVVRYFRHHPKFCVKTCSNQISIDATPTHPLQRI